MNKKSKLVEFYYFIVTFKYLKVLILDPYEIDNLISNLYHILVVLLSAILIGFCVGFLSQLFAKKIKKNKKSK